MANPLVSVIVPAYNAEAFIGETLNSVRSQTYKNLEIIVIDDGSKDCTSAIVKEFAHRDARIRFLQQSNRGVAAARNLAIRESRGTYLAPLDADDIWYPAKIEKQVAVLEKGGPRAACAYNWTLSIDESGNILDAGPKWDVEGNVFQALVLKNFMGNASVPLFRREVVEEVGGYNEDLRAKDAQGCEDWEICLRIAENYEYRVVQEYLVGYRCYSQSMSYNHTAMGRSYTLVMEEVRRRHPEIPGHLFRWSHSIFYLYLTHKSNMCGDLQDSLRWLLCAVKEDWAAVLLPWVPRCLISRLTRHALASFFKLLGRPDDVWRLFRRSRIEPTPVLSYSEAIANEGRMRLWDRVQLQRWALVTNKRTFSC